MLSGMGMTAIVANAHVPSITDLPALRARPPSLSAKSAPTSAIGADGSLASLVGFIVDRHHARTRSELRRLAALGTIIEEIDAAFPGVKAVLDLFAALDSELRAHMTKEEMVVFPYIVSLEAHLLRDGSVVRSPFGVLERPLGTMLDEQCQTRSLLASMRSVSNGYAPPPEASMLLAQFYRDLVAFEQGLSEHGRLETEVLFPRALELEARTRG
jgi:regulator of cell morphogenesis and NO signaling